MRFLLFTSALILLSGSSALAERQSLPNATAQAAMPAFQVATIKPSKPDQLLSIQIQGRRFATMGTTLIDVLKYAYGVHANQIVDGPAWLGTEKFDLLADPDSETRPSSDEMKKMVQQLVADRFHLSFHRAKRELPAYAIVAAKSGPKLTKSTRDPNGIPAGAFSPSGKLSVGNATIADLGTFLQRYVTDRPVVDQTGITGKYDLNLAWTPDESRINGSGHATEDSNAQPGLFTAIQEQLGLKLEAAKLPVDVFVIDHVEQPSEN
jgi:uncharacterized protein (TIGR03435 family)